MEVTTDESVAMLRLTRRLITLHMRYSTGDDHFVDNKDANLVLQLGVTAEYNCWCIHSEMVQYAQLTGSTMPRGTNKVLAILGKS